MKPCHGSVALAAIKGSELVAPKPYEPLKKKYVPPSERPIDLTSQTSFPALSPMRHSEGASWSQIRSRLTDEATFKRRIEIRIEREEKELAEGIRQEQVTDPLEMTPEQLATNGWHVLRRPETFTEPIEFPEDYLYNARTPWSTVGIPIEIMNNPSKAVQFVECVHLDGTPVERQVYVDLFQKEIIPVVNYATEQKSKNRLLAFVRKHT